jgi:hypothetical protein
LLHHGHATPQRGNLWPVRVKRGDVSPRDVRGCARWCALN